MDVMGTVNFNGNELGEAVLPLAPTTGSFVGQICRNTSFYPVIWNGSSWVVIPSGSDYAWKNFTGTKIDGGTASVASSAARTTIVGQRGTGILMHTTSYAAGVYFTFYVDTGVVTCRPENVVYVSTGYNDSNVVSNNGGTVLGHYTDIETAMSKYAAFGNTGEKYLVYVNTGNYTVNSYVEIPEHICLHLATNVNISGTGTFALLNGAKLVGQGHVGCKITAVGLSLSCTIEADTINDIGICGRAKVRCNTLRNILVSVGENDTFDVQVDCIEIGNVKTSFHGLDSTLQPSPNVITDKIINNLTPLYCVCHNTHGVFTCPYSTPCVVGAAGQTFSEALLTYYTDNAKLTIRANRRMSTSKFFVTVGTVRATYLEHNSQVTDSPENYIAGLDPYVSTAVQLDITNANETTINLGYQVADGAILRLNNVRHKCVNNDIEANIYRDPTGNFDTRVSLKSTVLVGNDAIGHNVVGSSAIPTLLSSLISFGNRATPTINCTDVLGTSLNQVSTEYWI